MRWLYLLLFVAMMVLGGLYVRSLLTGESLSEVYLKLMQNQEETYVVARKSLDRLQERKQGIPIEQWTSYEKAWYDACKRVLKEYEE